MSIYYYSFTRFPSEKAHALYLAKVAASFAEQGEKVTVITPKRLGVTKKTYSDYYGIPETFCTFQLPVIDVFQVPLLHQYAHRIGVVTFAISAMLFHLFQDKKSAFLFTNDVFIAWVFSLFSKRVVFELHDYPHKKSSLYLGTFKRVYKVITNNHQKKLLVHADYDVPIDKILAVHNGVNIDEFVLSKTKAEARQELCFKPHSKIVMYTGHLFDWKGADLLADAAAFLPDMEFVFVGGTDKDVLTMRQKYKSAQNVHFLGHRPHKLIPLYQKAADILVLPNTAKQDVSRLHTSPMKVFEYMASGVLIVASDIPSIREVLSEKNALFFTPDDVGSLQTTLRTALALSAEEKNVLLKNGTNLAQEYTWKNRATKILQWL